MNFEEMKSELQETADSQWSKWKNHPISKILFQYLNDFSVEISSHIKKAFENGNLLDIPQKDLMKDMSYFDCLSFMQELKLEDVKKFYGLEESNDK